MRSILLITGLLALWSTVLLEAAPKTVNFKPIDKASKIRILDKGPKGLIYGLRIKTPWSEGGELYINLPEHLEGQRWQGILRHNDAKKGATAKWIPAADGLSAKLDAECPDNKGLWVRGEARVTDKDRVDIRMTIENNGREDLTWIKPLYCIQYRTLKGFPGWVEKEEGNREHTFMVIDGECKAIVDIIKDEGKEDPGILKGEIKNSKMTEFKPNVDTKADAALLAVTSMDDKRKLIAGWTPGSYILANPSIPCMHADGFYGKIRKGESKYILGTFVFTEADLQVTVKKLMDEGVGDPGSNVSDQPGPAAKPAGKAELRKECTYVHQQIKAVLDGDAAKLKDSYSRRMQTHLESRFTWEEAVKGFGGAIKGAIGECAIEDFEFTWQRSTATSGKVTIKFKGKALDGFEKRVVLEDGKWKVNER